MESLNDLVNSLKKLTDELQQEIIIKNKLDEEYSNINREQCRNSNKINDLHKKILSVQSAINKQAGIKE